MSDLPLSAFLLKTSSRLALYLHNKGADITCSSSSGNHMSSLFKITITLVLILILNLSDLYLDLELLFLILILILEHLILILILILFSGSPILDPTLYVTPLSITTQILGCGYERIEIGLPCPPGAPEIQSLPAPPAKRLPVDPGRWAGWEGVRWLHSLLHVVLTAERQSRTWCSLPLRRRYCCHFPHWPLLLHLFHLLLLLLLLLLHSPRLPHWTWPRYWWKWNHLGGRRASQTPPWSCHRLWWNRPWSPLTGQRMTQLCQNYEKEIKVKAKV